MRHLAGAAPLLIAGLLAGVLPPAKPAWAEAAKPAPAPPPVSADPTVTTASFGDWTTRCEKGAGDKPQRICEAVQTVQLPNAAAPVAQIAFGHASSTEPVKLVLVLPVDVWFPSTVRVFGADKDAQGVELTWRRCLPVGCFAENAAPDDAMRRWRGETGQGRIAYKDGVGRDVALPISFRGLAQALDALAKQ